MSDLVPFDFEGHPVRALAADGGPWLIAADACGVLSIRDTSSALKMVDPEDVRRFRRSDSPQIFVGIAPQVQEITVVNESGLYALIFHSRKPEARRFKRWVTHEVLPALRKTGRYEVAPATIELSVDEYERLLDGGKQMVTKLRSQQQQIETQVKELDSTRPKAAYVDAFINPAEDVTTIGDFAKELGIRAKDLRDYLVQRKRIYKRVLPRRWSASKQREEVEYEWRYHAGFEAWFTLKEQPDAPRRHNGQIRMTLYVTPVGKERIQRMLATDPIGGAA